MSSINIIFVLHGINHNLLMIDISVSSTSIPSVSATPPPKHYFSFIKHYIKSSGTIDIINRGVMTLAIYSDEGLQLAAENLEVFTFTSFYFK